MPDVQPNANIVEDEPAPLVETPEPPELVEEEMLVEDVSIDGMCGVY
jgi:mycofactocin precursor